MTSGITHHDFIHSLALHPTNAPVGSTITLLFECGKNEYDTTLVTVTGWGDGRMYYVFSGSKSMGEALQKDWPRYRVLRRGITPNASDEPVPGRASTVPDHTLRDRILLALIPQLIPRIVPVSATQGSTLNPTFYAEQLQIWTDAIHKAHVDARAAHEPMA